jgi:glycosyltransferase involved in cell wall biosynthesis
LEPLNIKLDRTLRILNIIGSVDVRGGGTTNHVFSISRVWSRLGHECHLLSLDPPDSPSVAASPMPTIALGSQDGNFRFLRRFIPFARYGYTPALGRWLRANAEHYDAIILNGLWNYTSFGTWLTVRMLNVPYYVCPHGMLDPWLRKWSPMHHVRRLIFWRFFERRVVRDSQGIFFACEEEKELADGSFLCDGKYDGFVSWYGVEEPDGDPDVQKAAFLARYSKLRGRRFVLFLGRIHPKKGIDLLVKAFLQLSEEFPDLDLVIAGPDDIGLGSRLRRLAANAGVERRIHWTGMLGGNEKWGAFRAAEYFVLPSHQENFGISIVEAMAAAVPVLVTKRVNIWREVEISGGGVATDDTVDGVATGLRDLLNLTPFKRQNMASKARAGYLARFDLDKNAANLLKLIARLNGTYRLRRSDGR